MQPQRPGLAPVHFLGFCRRRGGREWEVLRQLESVTAYTCCMRAGEICSGTLVAVLALVLFSNEICWVYSLLLLLLVAPAFLLILSHLYVSVFQVWVGWKWNGVSPKTWRSWTLPPPLYWQGELFLASYFLSWEWDNVLKIKLSFFPSLCSYLQVFCFCFSTVLLKFLRWTRVLPGCFCSSVAV